MEGFEALAEITYAHRRRIGWTCIGGTSLIFAGALLVLFVGLGGLIIIAIGFGIQLVTVGCFMAIEFFHPTGAAARFAEYGFDRVLAVMRPVAGLMVALWIAIGVVAPVGMIVWIVKQMLR